MPSKIQLDVNLWFLYICLQKSDYKAIDFAAVGAATKLKAPAARMRFTRLKKTIESGSLNISPETAFTGSLPDTLKTSKTRGKAKPKRKTAVPKPKPEATVKKEVEADMDPTSNANLYPMAMRPRPVKAETNQMDIDDDPNDAVIKYASSGGSEYEADGIESDGDDDDIPLAKKRKAAMMVARHVSSKKLKTEEDASMLSGGAAVSLNNAEATVGASGLVQTMDRNAAGYEDATLTVHRNAEQTGVDLGMTEIDTHLFDDDRMMASPFEFRPREKPKAHDGLQSTQRSTQFHYDPARYIVRYMDDDDLTMATQYRRHPAMAATSERTWMGYRIPTITVTDTEPLSSRNHITPHSTRALDPHQQALNQLLFGPNSSAFMHPLRSHPVTPDDLQQALLTPGPSPGPHPVTPDDLEQALLTPGPSPGLEGLGNN
ncbi:hypothetical protein AJ80_06369 [Polytolypa hystricis UAMH7299]|uniref:Myb-like DNA-binding domain-containing protein n=1 Tax=Polytolypa hystricis (strain UAMH7299) TaxID=1447883 RepID=A0A2B7XW75_POLH7|nr:hypothetical protein AJ80_06369 [Polytolypa hystricis UAMH7299]